MGKDLGLGCPHVRRGHPGEDGGSGEGEKAEEGRLGLGFGSVCYPSFLSSLFFYSPNFLYLFPIFFSHLRVCNTNRNILLTSFL